jgi:hypothetical protein
MLEPNGDTLVGTSGERDQSLEENGSVNLTQGQEEVVVSFLTQKFSADYEFNVYIENLVDADQTVIQWIPLARGTNGFTLGLGPQPDSPNYVLYWRVRVRDTATLSISQVDAPEAAVTPLAVGQTSQIITFFNPRSTTSYDFSEFILENVIDGPGQQTEWVQITGRTQQTFTISINPPTDTPNYSLRWRLA